MGTVERDRSSGEGKADDDISRAKLNAPEDCWVPMG